MERYTNKRRSPQDNLKEGDEVWLSLKNIPTDRPSKKLDWRNAPYRIIKVLSPLTYKLNTPPGIYPVFHTSLLRKKQTDPFPSQILTDPAILLALQDTEGNDE